MLRKKGSQLHTLTHIRTNAPRCRSKSVSGGGDPSSAAMHAAAAVGAAVGAGMASLPLPKKEVSAMDVQSG